MEALHSLKKAAMGGQAIFFQKSFYRYTLPASMRVLTDQCFVSTLERVENWVEERCESLTVDERRDASSISLF